MAIIKQHEELKKINNSSFQNYDSFYSREETALYKANHPENLSSSKSGQNLKRLVIGAGSVVVIVGIVSIVSVSYSDLSPFSLLRQDGSASLVSKDFIDIDIKDGRIRGYLNTSREGRSYYSFFKVPYAEPPVGNLRFIDPQPRLRGWDGVRDNPQIGPQCIQNKKYAPTLQATGEEDCLYANIYTPKLPQTGSSGELLPVMVFIHGGGYIFGTTDYGGTYFMDHDVILITFEYRLGPFGFLSTGDDVIRGNMGQKDQIQMLKWVQENIKDFGGDPNLVTIFGSSGGALFVSHLLLSPLATGLFQRAISQSGAALCPMFYNHNVKKTAEAIGRKMGCDVKDTQKYWKCLVGKDAGELAMLQGDGITYSTFIDPGVASTGDYSPFLEDIPLKLTQSGKIHSVPYIIGNVNAEYYATAVGLLRNSSLIKELNENFEHMSKALLGTDLEPEIMQKVKEFYFKGKQIGNETFYELGDLISDWDLVHCSYLAARYHAKTNANTYLYYMTKVPKKSNIEKQFPGYPAYEQGIVAHGDELHYLFPYGDRYFPYIDKNDPDYFQISRDWIRLWVHFAKTGNGDVKGLGDARDVSWIKVNEIGNGYANSTFRLELNDRLKMTRETQDRMAFWDQFDIETELKYGGNGAGNTLFV